MRKTEEFVRAWGDYLNGFAWDHWVTLTSRVHECSAERLTAEFTRRFVRRLERYAKRRIGWFYAMEQTRAGSFHVHALLHGSGALSPHALQQAWQLGISKVDRYRLGHGASWYLAKEIGTVPDDRLRYDLSRRMAPRLSLARDCFASRR